MAGVVDTQSLEKNSTMSKSSSSARIASDTKSEEIELENNNNIVKSLENPLNEEHKLWLRENDLVVKIMPRNQESLFRALAESLFLSQSHYEKVKIQVIKYITDRRTLVEQKIRLVYAKEFGSKPLGPLERDVYRFGKACGKEPVTPWHAYMYRLENGSNVAGLTEIAAVSSLYKCKILVYRSIPSPPLVFGKYDVDDCKIIKLLNFFGSNHYDLLISTSTAKSAALCQSVVYELLYEKVFGLQNTLAASSMALGKQVNKLDGGNDSRRTNVKRLANKLDAGNESDAIKYVRNDMLPFPLKIAKGLDSTSFHDSNLDGQR